VVQCVAVCSSVLQSGTVCCSVLQGVAVCCSVLQSVAGAHICPSIFTCSKTTHSHFTTHI